MPTSAKYQTVTEWPSGSDPSKTYRISRDTSTGELSCNCRGWIFFHATRGDCKHIREYKKSRLGGMTLSVKNDAPFVHAAASVAGGPHHDASNMLSVAISAQTEQFTHAISKAMSAQAKAVAEAAKNMETFGEAAKKVAQNAHHLLLTHTRSCDYDIKHDLYLVRVYTTPNETDYAVGDQVVFNTGGVGVVVKATAFPGIDTAHKEWRLEVRPLDPLVKPDKTKTNVVTTGVMKSSILWTKDHPRMIPMSAIHQCNFVAEAGLPREAHVVLFVGNDQQFFDLGQHVRLQNRQGLYVVTRSDLNIAKGEIMRVELTLRQVPDTTPGGHLKRAAERLKKSKGYHEPDEPTESKPKGPRVRAIDLE